MDEEDRKKLDRILELAEDNNAYIKKVRSVQKTAQLFKTIYWIVLIVVALGGFYFIQPYVTRLVDVYSGTSASFSQVQSVLNKLNK